jgi:rhamnosyltransferase
MELAMSTIKETSLPVDKAVSRSHVAIIIPTINARVFWDPLSAGLRLQGFPPEQVLIVDSSSDDGTRELAAKDGYRVDCIDRKDFNHGGTRQAALALVPWARIVVYLTQDAILANPDALDRLLAAFEDSDVAAAYGRQLPRAGAGAIEAHARLFNYPEKSEVRDFESRHALGIKAAFLSNSFAAYRVDELQRVGGFSPDVIMAEDALVAGKLLLAGRKLAYVAESQVYHSHAFSVAQEFRRYFDTGVYHRSEAWLCEKFGKPNDEGVRFVLSELSYLMRRAPYLIPYALFRTVTKALGYKLGKHGARLGRGLSKKFSYHKRFWDLPTGLSGEVSKTSGGSNVTISGPPSLG